MFEVVLVDTPETSDGQPTLGQLNKLLAEDEIAGFILEPLVQGAGGMRMYAPEGLLAVVRAVQENGALVIFDEIMTGFGRTGKLFAHQHLSGFCPDIICLSKGLTGGFLPMGLTVFRQSIYEEFRNAPLEGTFFHGHSFTANPLACAAANASLGLFEEQATWDGIRLQVEMHKQFASELATHPVAQNVRQTGTILAFDLVSKEKGYLSSIGPAFASEILKYDVLLRPLGNVVYLMLPYCASKDDMLQVYHSILSTLQKLSALELSLYPV
jgi:adenosylmethionine-8-amino-7-oxononanoate aminotransferase